MWPAEVKLSHFRGPKRQLPWTTDRFLKAQEEPPFQKVRSAKDAARLELEKLRKFYSTDSDVYNFLTPTQIRTIIASHVNGSPIRYKSYLEDRFEFQRRVIDILNRHLPKPSDAGSSSSHALPVPPTTRVPRTARPPPPPVTLQTHLPAPQRSSNDSEYNPPLQAVENPMPDDAQPDDSSVYLADTQIDDDSFSPSGLPPPVSAQLDEVPAVTVHNSPLEITHIDDDYLTHLNPTQLDEPPLVNSTQVDVNSPENSQIDTNLDENAQFEVNPTQENLPVPTQNSPQIATQLEEEVATQIEPPNAPEPLAESNPDEAGILNYQESIDDSTNMDPDVQLHLLRCWEALSNLSDLTPTEQTLYDALQPFV